VKATLWRHRPEWFKQQLATLEVPLLYSSELYELHAELRQVLERLQALQQRQSKLG
jgi:hypothetical protein